MREGRDERDEQASELRRYLADSVAARLPLARSLAGGAVAGLLVYAVPIAVVVLSMLLVSVTYNFGALPFEVLARLLGRQPSVAVTDAPALVPSTPLPVESVLPPDGMPAAGTAEWLTIGLVFFWPVAMLGIGALVAVVYRARRAHRRDELDRTPLEFSIVPEVALFYGLTAGAGLLVGVGSFVAIGTNVIFSWAGFLIWRWLFDRVAWRIAPTSVRVDALACVDRERLYRRRLRESG